MQVISLTEELLATARQNDISGQDVGTAAGSHSFAQTEGDSQNTMV